MNRQQHRCCPPFFVLNLQGHREPRDSHPRNIQLGLLPWDPAWQPVFRWLDEPLCGECHQLLPGDATFQVSCEVA